MTWRWDQGRLEYVLYENLRPNTSALLGLSGRDLRGPDPLRAALEEATELPFLPRNYTVWRNYKRVFGQAMVATEVDDRLVLTDIGRYIVQHNATADEYFGMVVPRFTFPSPVFQGYRAVAERTYPFCAILKCLITRPQHSPGLSVKDVFELLIANDVKGTEDLGFYASLRRRNLTPVGDQERQVRELVRFLSQLSWVKWIGRKLILDCDLDVASQQILNLATPIIRAAEGERHREMLQMCSLPDAPTIVEVIAQSDVREEEEEVSIPEGRRLLRYHTRIERSAVLRGLFLRSTRFNGVCDMCHERLRIKYPWLEYLIEIHHLLPLSSPAWVNYGGVSLADLVGICPNCHRAVHKYYGTYLQEQQRVDFTNRDDAKDAYEYAKDQVRRFGPQIN